MEATATTFKEAASCVMVESKEARKMSPNPKPKTQEEEMNEFLDQVSTLNNGWADWVSKMESVFDALDFISHFELEDEEDKEAAAEIIDILSSFYRKLARDYSSYSKSEFLNKTSKSYLVDTRIVLRNLKEYIEDLKYCFTPTEQQKQNQSEIQLAL